MENLYSLTNISPFLQPQSPTTTVLISDMSSTFLDCTFKCYHAVFVFHCLAYFFKCNAFQFHPCYCQQLDFLLFSCWYVFFLCFLPGISEGEGSTKVRLEIGLFCVITLASNSQNYFLKKYYLLYRSDLLSFWSLRELAPIYTKTLQKNLCCVLCRRS